MIYNLSEKRKRFLWGQITYVCLRRRNTYTNKKTTPHRGPFSYRRIICVKLANSFRLYQRSAIFSLHCNWLWIVHWGRFIPDKASSRKILGSQETAKLSSTMRSHMFGASVGSEIGNLIIDVAPPKWYEILRKDRYDIETSFGTSSRLLMSFKQTAGFNTTIQYICRDWFS